MEVHNIYIVEDHLSMREMLREFLDMVPDFHVTGVAETAEEALQELPELDVHLLLIDVSLSGMSGIDLAEEVGARWPELPCLMFSAHEEASYARRSLAVGARGYVLKGNPDELSEAIWQVLEGTTYVSPPLREKLSDQLNQVP